MCGIAGLVFTENHAPAAAEEMIRAMSEAQRERGPDGIYSWTNGRVALGMVRLAVVGSEARGRQPIEGASGARLIFNGELYDPVGGRGAGGPRLRPRRL